MALIQELAQLNLKLCSISGFRLALPNREDSPAGGIQREFVGGIALNIACNLGSPVRRVRFWLSRAADTFMSVPETTGLSQIFLINALFTKPREIPLPM